MTKKVGDEPINVVIDDLKLVFVSIPKCGNRSIKHLIVDRLGYGDKSKHLWDLDYKYLKEVPGDYLKIAFVRNPYVRLVSLYKDKFSPVKNKKFLDLGFYKDMDFTEFCIHLNGLPPDNDPRIDVHLKSQYYFLTLNGEVIVDLIVPLETMQKNWKQYSDKVKHHCGIELPRLPHTHKSGRRKLINYYQKIPYTEMCVYERYKKDFFLLNYSHEVPYE